ncbi:MAG: hypothetical protein ACJAWS_002933, partial [Oleiphilaceae bacterium]
GIEHKTVLSHDVHYSDEQLLILKQFLENGN